MNQSPITLRRNRGFSLIEVTLAIGIMAFAMLPVMALLPIGLNIHRQAIDTTVSAQIISRVTHEVQQTDYSSLPLPPPNGTPLTYCFDDQGNLLTSGSSLSLFSSYTDNRRLYDVEATIYKPTALTGGTTPSLARVKIDVVSNPAHTSTVFNTDGSGNFITPNVSTYFSFVSKND